MRILYKNMGTFMLQTIKKALVVAAVCCVAAQTVFAGGIINGGNVNGYGTFIEVNTGRIWMDMDSFFDKSTNEMVAAANLAGFTFATKADVQALLGGLLLTGGEWASYKAIMMDAPNREIIWGSYDDGGNPSNSGWAFAYDFETSWTFSDGAVGNNTVPNGGTQFADMNIWAYREGAVPEPASIAMWGLGALGATFARRKRRQMLMAA